MMKHSNFNTFTTWGWYYETPEKRSGDRLIRKEAATWLLP